MRPIRFARHPGRVVATMALGLALGCADQSMEPMIASRNVAKVESPDSMPAPMYKAVAPGAPSAEADDVSKASATAGRKIIYNARIDLVTEDLSGLEAKLLALIATAKAYVADSDRTGSAGTSLRGSWKVRVPVEGYDAFVRGATGLGELVSLKADSQDVSEEYFDLDARQAAKKVEEERLLKHLTESTGKLEDILAVERELSRVRTEIERMQGRLRALANLTTLATVTISASEIKGYVPPQAPTLGTRVTRAFSESVESLQDFGESCLIAIVSIAPWLPILVIGGAIVLVGIRRLIAWLTRINFIDVPPPPAGRG
jgi:hypothetical protein